ncbi:hypothetical protein KUTeg_002820 [Tegillarca granosa]|uniref:Transcriptional coactivator p15 (PC4) C-terminal domain-containing protein n=1 Tax=Tegillarca granosa TaxID=220873 RepID=A0ABQ9FQW4_TEGGR|nr:hypothetical protein KUTeg_002820 [Tegillarca granosa]
MSSSTPVCSIPEISQFGPIKKESRKKIRYEVLKKVKKNLQSDFDRESVNNYEPLVIDDTIHDDKLTETCLDTPKTFQDNVELCRLHLGDERYVVAVPFKGELKIHIRQYEVGNKGRYPTNRGVALNLEKWKKLEELYSSEVDTLINKFDREGETVDCKYHLGSNFYVSVKRLIARVDIRRWFLPQDAENIVPTRKGISLTFAQWNYVKSAMSLIRQLLRKELDETDFCENSGDHHNQMGYFSCANCNPNGYMDLLDN